MEIHYHQTHHIIMIFFCIRLNQHPIIFLAVRTSATSFTIFPQFDHHLHWVDISDHRWFLCTGVHGSTFPPSCSTQGIIDKAKRNKTDRDQQINDALTVLVTIFHSPLIVHVIATGGLHAGDKTSGRWVGAVRHCRSNSNRSFHESSRRSAAC